MRKLVERLFNWCGRKIYGKANWPPLIEGAGDRGRGAEGVPLKRGLRIGAVALVALGAYLVWEMQRRRTWL
jgi:hypothetical protein